MASGPVAAVLAGRSSGDVRVRVTDPDGARAVLERAGYRVSEVGGVLHVVAVASPGELTRMLGEHGHWLTELTPVAVDLEAVFLDLTGEAA